VNWRLIESLDISDERTPVLLLRQNKFGPGFYVIQATPFGGYLYPDHLEDNVSWDDQIEDALYWRKMPAMPPMMELSVGRTLIGGRKCK
jgi:hypothetical protein